ncbi:MAG: type VI secretion system contractile sheath domain-containing protein [Rubrivivax sp.]
MSNSTDWTPDFGVIGTPPPTWPTKRPVRIAILGDFGAGALSGRLATGAELAKRKPLKVEFDTLEDAMSRLKLKLNLPLGASGAPVEIEITELESFHPDALYRNLEIFSALASLRKRLNTPSTFAKAAAEVQGWGKGGVKRASSVSRQARARGAAPASGAKLDDFARLTGRPAVTAGADDSMDALLRSIVGPFVVPAASPNKDALVASVDKSLADAMRAVLHQPDFQNVESLWRGVDFLLRRLETSHELQVHLIDISAEELTADLSTASDLSETGLYKLLVEQPSQDADGGYSYLCGCYQFDAAPPHAELLGRAMQVAAHAAAPVITGIHTDPFIDRKEPPHRLVREAFAALRALPEASYLALIGPRFMLRQPYGKRSDPISSFAMEEFTREDGLSGMLWGHSGLLALCVLGVPGGQLSINDLSFHHYVDADGDSVALPCTDRLINTNASTLLRDYGITAVMAHKGEALVRLAGLEAINGDGLAAAGGTARKATGASRVAVQGKIDKSAKLSVDWSPARRSAGTVSVSAAPQRLVEAEEDAEPASVETPETDDAVADEVASSERAERAESVDGGDDAASGESGGDTSELDALLASLSSDDAPASTSAADPAAGGEPAMDPDLEALLKSLG